MFQNRSAGDARDRSVLSCLAAIAADPSYLPSFALYVNGVTSVTDSLTLGHTITAAPAAFTAEALATYRKPQPEGTMDGEPSGGIRTTRGLTSRLLVGDIRSGKSAGAYSHILGDPQVLLDNKPHFGVEERLAGLPPGWVKVGHCQDVPKNARYKWHRGDTWIWVMPADSEAFSQFTLVLQDIATLDPTVITPPPLLVQLTTFELTKIPDPSDRSKFVTIGTGEIRAIKLAYRAEIEKAIQDGMANGEVNLTREQWLAYTEPWYGVRSSNTISAAAPSLSAARHNLRN